MTEITVLPPNEATITITNGSTPTLLGLERQVRTLAARMDLMNRNMSMLRDDLNGFRNEMNWASTRIHNLEVHALK